MSSETASFTDPQFLAQFGLNRINALEYFLHPLNPFRTKAKTSNEILAMQGISISLIMYNNGITNPHQSGQLTLERAEEEYNTALSRLMGEQYELLHPSSNKHGNGGMVQSPLFTVRHLLRTKNKVTTLGIYYILEGVIYKSPSARALMKYNVARTSQGLIDACDTLSVCANYTPTTGYYWDFEAGKKLKKRKRGTTESGSDASDDGKDHDGDGDSNSDEVEIFQQLRKKITKKLSAVDKKRRPEERTEEEEEGTRAKDKINSILMRISKTSLVTGSRQTVR